MTTSQKKEYPTITKFGYIADDKVFLKGYLSYPDREIGIVRDSDEKSLQYFVARFEAIQKKFEDIKASVETAENKGSFLMKLLHLRSKLLTYNGLGDFLSLLKSISDLESDISIYILNNREKNLAIKQALLKESEAIKNSTDWKTVALALKELKTKWIKTGSAYKEYEEELNEQFNKNLEFFFEKRRVYFNKQAEEIKEKLDKYNKLLSDIKKINRMGGGVTYLNEVKNIQKLWKDVGRVPAKKLGKVGTYFKKEIDIYFKNLKGSKDGFVPRKTGIALKKELLEMTENILNLGAPFNIGKVKQLQNDWKNVGKLAEPEDKDLNLKFRIACNEIFESHFLDRTAFNLIDGFYQKTPREQNQAKIDILDKSIRQDSKELNEFNAKYGAKLDANPYAPENSNLLQERNNFINKLKTKQRIMKKLKELL
jgi:hypothetical protein